jgi:WD40 repeat protein
MPGFRQKPFTASQHTLMAAIALADGAIELWQPTNSTRVARWTAHDQSVTAISFSPDDDLLATGSNNDEVKLWHTRTRRLLRLLGPPEGVVYGLAFSPDGGTLAACGQSRRIRTWDTASGQERVPLLSSEAAEALTINSVTFSPLGQMLAATTLQSNEAQLWDWHSGRRLAVLKGHIQGVRHAAFSPDGKTLATASGDRKVKLWNLATYQELATFEMPGPCISVAFGRDGRTLAAGCYLPPGGGLIRLWSAPAIDMIDK